MDNDSIKLFCTLERKEEGGVKLHLRRHKSCLITRTVVWGEQKANHGTSENLVSSLPHTQAPPSFPSLAVWKSGRGPGIFSHVSDARIERMVERV